MSKRPYRDFFVLNPPPIWGFLHVKYLWAALESLYGLEYGKAERINHRFGEGNRFHKMRSFIPKSKL
jgi:hypothetical protein